jgi:ABC-type polysaccharide/polyol phosphate transport system ATPase subunit
MDSIAIEVKDLNVKYKFVKNMNMKQEIVKFFTRKNKEKRVKEVWALKNVNFTVEKGKTVGIIGSNGSGKTTLLKTIANIFKPDSGEIKLHSNSVSLLTLGAGFQPELSGIENIYLNGLLLGFNKKDIDKRLDDIVEFSDIGEFIYHPIKTYSSGMKTRLAFSIVSHIEPDILLIDEVLGVGDESFRKKSEARLKELISDNRTVLIVSHSLSAVQNMCDEVLWIDKGEVMGYGAPNEIIKQYKDFVKHSK